MIYIVCLTCSSSLRVAGDLDELDHLVGQRCDWYPSSYPCWKDGCRGPAQFLERVEATALQRLDVRDLNPQEAFLALQQMGLPEERECSAAAVQRAFEKSPIKHVEAHHIKDSHRCTIEYIELEDGTKIHFAAAPSGAVIYRVSKPHSYVRETHEQTHSSPRP